MRIRWAGHNDCIHSFHAQDRESFDNLQSDVMGVAAAQRHQYLGRGCRDLALSRRCIKKFAA